MRSLFQPKARASIGKRFNGLSPTATPRWGRMTAPQMLAHCNDGFGLATGEIPTRVRRTWARFPPINYLIACFLPFPRHAPMARELFARVPDEWHVELARLHANMERFAAQDRRAPRPLHPFFGPLPWWAWGLLGYRHLDHHLRQFGA